MHCSLVLQQSAAECCEQHRMVQLQYPHPFKLLVKGDWPQLSLNVLHDSVKIGFFWCENAKLELLARFVLQQPKGNKDSVAGES